LNRQDRCRFEEFPQPSLSEPPRDEESVKRLASLESTVVKLTSVVSELKSVISHSSTQAAHSSTQIGYTRMGMALINRNEQVSDTGIMQNEPLGTIAPVAAPSRVENTQLPVPQPQLSFPPVDLLERPTKFPNRDEIYNIISVYKPPVTIGPVSRFLVNHWTFKDTTITEFRVSKFKSPTEDANIEWLMLQWNEPELDCEAFALFMVNIQIGLCSTLVHSGFGDRQPDGRRWFKHSLAWWVLSMEDLKKLFMAGQQVLEVMNWPDPVMIKGFFDPTQTECSVGQYAPFPQEANL
jgi:hypothetical protein